MNKSKPEKKEYIACYKSDQWKLITREITTYKHAVKLSEKYKDSYQIKIIKLDFSLDINKKYECPKCKSSALVLAFKDGYKFRCSNCNCYF